MSPAGAASSAGGGDAGLLLLQRFKDQFSCWDFSSHDIRRPVPATLLRLPLRTLASSSTALTPLAWDAEGAELGQQLAAFCREAGHSLLLLARLQQVVVRVVGHARLGAGQVELWRGAVSLEPGALRPGGCTSLLLVLQLVEGTSSIRWEII